MLALKYRPQTFEDVVGQERAIKTLTSSIGKASTFILYGDSGVGKTTLARLFADAVNGEIMEINGASNNGVDDIRGLISAATYQPAFNDYRVFVIDECHMLTNNAWNALLKILEESPKTTLWVLCTTEYAKIPQTIKSRSVSIALSRLSIAQVKARLVQIVEKEDIDISDEDLDRIVSHSEGRMREAISALDTYASSGELCFSFGYVEAIQLLTDVFDGKFEKVVTASDNLSNEDTYQLIRFIRDYITLVLLRMELPPKTSTESILEEYTSISPTHLVALRALQDSISRCVPSNRDVPNGSVRLMYALFNDLMAHYNDFRDNRITISITLENFSMEVNDEAYNRFFS